MALERVWDSFKELILSPGVNLPDPIFLPALCHPPIPEFEIIEHEEEGKVEIEFPIMEQGSTGYSIISRKFRAAEINTSVHDFTLEFFTLAPEEKLSRFFPVMNDGMDHLTPDIIKISQESSMVIEFTTCRSGLDVTYKKAFNVKVDAYHQALSNRAQKSIMFYIVVVTVGGVYTNMPLDQQDVDELCLRFRTSIAFGTELSTRGYKTLTRVEEDRDKKKTRDALNMIKHDFKKASFMNEKVYKNFFEEPDSDYLKKIISRSQAKVEEKLKAYHHFDKGITTKSVMTKSGLRHTSGQQNANHLECKAKIEAFKESCEGPNRRSDLKSIFPAPFWVLSEGTGSTDLSEEGEIDPFQPIGESDDPTFQVWKEVVFEFNSRSANYERESVQLEENIALKLEDESDFKLNKLKYHRVKPTIADDVQIEIAKVGVEGKKHKKDILVETYRELKKQPFSLSAPTEDIETLLQDAHLFSFACEGRTSREILMEDLMFDAYKVHQVAESKHNVDFMRFFLNSKFGRWCTFWTDVCTELAISMKQHCRKGEFIVKKLRDFDVYLLIKSTDSSKHIFYSLMVYDESVEDFNTSTCFKHFHANGIVKWTDFSSYNSSKLVNGVKFQSMMFSCLAFWLEFHKIPFWLKNKFYGSNEWKETWYMTMFTAMIALSDKTKLEEQITLSRFITMEGFVTTPCIPKPHKMLEKINTIPRTRIEVFVINRLLDYMERITSGYLFSFGKSSTGVRWENLWNPFSKKQLIDPHQVINVMYLGYLKNKDEPAESNSIGQMFEKILEYEDRRPGSNKYLGIDDPVTPNFHEYSKSLITKICQVGKVFLKQQLGNAWLDQVDDEIITRLTYISLLDVTTLKASSLFDEDHYEGPKELEEVKRVLRKKVLEVLPEYISEETSLIDIMPRVLADLKKQDCLHIDIFRKPQHGGLREIYVLGIKERLCQLMVETIARAIASFFPSETMTHPENKYNIPEMHTKRAVDQLGESHITVATSDDASKWNQGHFVSKFAHILCSFTKPYLHPLIYRVTELWMRKRILIDPALVSLFIKHQDILLDGKYLNRMKNIYWGKDSARWMQPGNQYIETKTGMLQGIFHYGSSLLHTLYLIYFKNYTIKYFQACFGKAGCKPRVVVSTMQSSDDSSMMISFQNTGPLSLQVGMRAAACCFHMKKELSIYLGIYDSVKSTSLTPFLVEFNSEFFFYKNLLRPTFRWVSALGSISEQESLAGRQEEMSSLLTNVLEGGASYGLTSLCQLGQMLLHYKLLGLGVSSLSNKFFRNLCKMPDPALGFFLLDNPLCAGLAGFNYNLWKMTKSSNLAYKYKALLKASRSAGRKSEFIDMTTSGSIVQSTMITWGNRKKWKRIFESLNPPEDWREQINENPAVLYVKPTTPESLKLRLLAKAASPGVTTSLSKGNVVSRVIASSVYSISRGLSVRQEQMLSDEDTEEVKKTSLFLLLTRDLNLDQKDLTPDEELILFPRALDHMALSQTLDAIPTLSGFVDRTPVRKVRTSISVTESEPHYFFKPIDLVKRAWFGIDKIAAATRIKDKLWVVLKTTFTWLKDTPAETLEDSPFDNHIQIQNFIARLEGKVRTVRLSGVPLKARFGMSNITTSIYQNRFHGFKCSTVIDLRAEEVALNYSQLYQQTYMILQTPYTTSRKTQAITTAIINGPDIQPQPSLKRTKRNTLAFMQRFLRTSNAEHLYTDLSECKMGVIGHFALRQARVGEEYRGKFVWRGLVGETTVALWGKNKTLNKMEVNTLRYKTELNLLMPTLLRDLMVENLESVVSGGCAAKLFKGQVDSKYSLHGAPIYVDDRLRFVFDAKKLDAVGFRVEGSRLRLVSSNTYRNLQVTILSLNITTPQTLVKLKPKEVGEPSRSWMSFRSMSPPDVASLTKMSKETIERSGFDYQDYRIWLRELFMGAVEERNILKPLYNQEYTQVLDDGQLLDEEEINFDFGFDEEGQLEDAEEILADADMNMLSFWPTELTEFGRTVTPAEKVTSVRLAGHPLLRDYVRDLQKNLSTRELNSIIRKKEYTTANENSLKQICFLLNMDREELRYGGVSVDPTSDFQFG